MENIPLTTLKYKSSDIEKFVFKSPSHAHTFMRKMFDDDTIEYNETCVCVFLNNSLETIGWTIISQGGMAGTVVDPKIVMTKALLSGAAAIALAHNHPSGKCAASNEDIRITKKISEACKFLDIKFVDHLIITNNSYCSMVETCDL